MRSQGKVKEFMKGLAGQAKELGSQWGPKKSLGRVVIQFDLCGPRCWSVLEQCRQVASAFLDATLTVPPTPVAEPRCPPTRDSRCCVCSLGNGTVAGRNSP